MQVFVIREFSNNSYKGVHVGVAESMLVAQIAAQAYMRSKYGSQAFWHVGHSEWQDGSGEMYRDFHCMNKHYSLIIQENHVLEVIDLMNPLDISLALTDNEKERITTIENAK